MDETKNHKLQHNIELNLAAISSTSSLIFSEQSILNQDDNIIYYMEESVLLGTKPLVDSIRHFIRDPSGVFSVCHLCECRVVQ